MSRSVEAPSPDSPAPTRLREEIENGQITDLHGRRLVGADLSGLDLSGANLSGCDLGRADLSGACLLRADLRGAVLFEANLEGAEFAGADLRGATLEKACARGAGFGEADLREARLFDTDLEGASLTGADLRGADLSAGRLRGARLVGARLEDAHFEGADLSGADLSEARVARARFDGADFSDARLARLRGFEKASFLGIDVRPVDFTGAYLLRREILDQNYLYEFRTGGRGRALLYRLWWLTSDCGRSMTRWLLFVVVVWIAFGVAYEKVGIDRGPHPTPLAPFYFSLVTLTTLGFGDVLPDSVIGQALVMAEVALGYAGLGGLLAILSTKMTRRAE